jgi:DNA modification methylase
MSETRPADPWADLEIPGFLDRTKSSGLDGTIPYHELAEIFPLLEGEAFADLVEDVRKPDGVREPIWLYEGKILDGRNRYRAALVAGVSCPTRTYEGDDPLAFVISLNLKRRHLDESQRAMVAAKLATLKLGANQHSEGPSIEGASRLLNVGHASVDRAKRVQRDGVPELVQAVERGDVKVSAAADIATESPERQREIVAQGEDQILAAAKAIRARRAEQSRAARIEKLAKIAEANRAIAIDQRLSVVRVLTGDCRAILPTLPSESVHCVVTSPPYWGLRDYGTATWEGGDPNCDHSPERRGSRFATPVSAKQVSNTGSGSAARFDCDCGARRIDAQLGLEGSLSEYIEAMRGVFREVWRVLRADGTLWLNMGDCYAAAQNGRSARDTKVYGSDNRTFRDKPFSTIGNGLKPKDLCGIPWRVAFALQEDGWYLRSDIIWSKPNPMPESVTDRPTKAHEYVFLMSKLERYFYDAEEIAEESIYGEIDARADKGRIAYGGKRNGDDGTGQESFVSILQKRNKRTVWEIPTAPFPEAHFATFPPALIEPCIKAGCPHKCCAKCGAPWVREIEAESADGRRAILRNGRAYDSEGRPLAGDNMIDAGVRGSFNVGDKGTLTRTTVGFSPSCSCNAATVAGTVLDPFGGAGTTGLVAARLRRDAILIELSPTYAAMAKKRIADDAPLLAQVALDHQADQATA